jgi:hypothetical protein
MRPSYCSACEAALDPVLPDCLHCGAHVEADPDAHHDRDLLIRRGHDRSGGVEVHRRWKLHVPWGMFVVLGLYSVAAYFYVQYTDQTSPETIGTQHLVAAQKLLGPDNGDTAPDADLLTAYGELITGLQILPEDAWGHQELDRVTWALAKRNQRPPPDLKRRADFLASARYNAEQGRKSVLPESPMERFQLGGIVDSAARLKRYLGLGGVVILLFWLYIEFQDYKFTHKRDDEHEVRRREELRALNAHRKR